MESSTEATAAATTGRMACNGLHFPPLTWRRPEARPVLLLHGFPRCSNLCLNTYGRREWSQEYPMRG